ncbi:hypothetical protein FQZ97_1103090 [compost metagenome]
MPTKRCPAGVCQQQLQVDPAVVARAEERQAIADIQRIALEVPGRVARVIAARARILHAEAADQQGQMG